MAATARATTRKTTARRPRALPPVGEPAESGPLSPGDFEPIRLSTPSEPAERVELFSIDDKPYTILRRPGASIGLEYMHLASIRGQNVAMDWLLGKLLGDEGYQALRDYDALSKEQFEQIVEIAFRLTMGAIETPKG